MYSIHSTAEQYGVAHKLLSVFIVKLVRPIFSDKMAVVRHKEAIHSGHFMVSNFEAEAQDEDDIAVPVIDKTKQNKINITIF